MLMVVVDNVIYLSKERTDPSSQEHNNISSFLRERYLFI